MKILWTDGSASPNPGPGGFAVIEDGKPVVLGKEKESSNIRMEGLAMIAAIEYAGDEGCLLAFTDTERLYHSALYSLVCCSLHSKQYSS